MRTKAYDITNKMIGELVESALQWGERHGVDNMAVLSSALRIAVERIDDCAKKVGHRHGGVAPYGDRAKGAPGGN